MTGPDTNSSIGATPPARDIPRVGDVLGERGLITPKQIERALAHQRDESPNKLLGQILVDLNYITLEDLVAALAEASGLAFVTITPSSVPQELLDVLPRAFIEKHTVLPISLSEGMLTVAVEDFTNIFLVEDIERLSGYGVTLVAATGENIRQVLASFGDGGRSFAFDKIIDEMQDDDLTVLEQRNEEPTDLQTAASDSPVIKLVNHIIHGAIHERASDIHIEPDQGIFRIRYRVDGELYEKLQPPFAMVPAIVSRIKIMAGMDIAERRVPQDGAITVVLDRNPVDLRVSTMPTKYGEKAVIRVIDNKGSTLDLSHLGFSTGMLAKMRGLITEPNGVILVTGPTGSGKTTTLYGCLAEIVSSKLNISTVEDPIEYNLFGINQFQVNEKAGFTFPKALRALLRQDPDVIMVGEIRDEPTAEIAIQSALTGHLVVSTLHTNDAPSAATRLMNMRIEPYLIAATLRGVLAQRLIRRICPHCRRPAEVTPALERTIRQCFGDAMSLDALFCGDGCARCRETGFGGRTGIYECLIPEDGVVEAIARGASLQELRQAAHRGNYTTLREDGIEKVKDGITTIESLLQIVARQGDVKHEPAGAEENGDWYVPSREGDP